MAQDPVRAAIGEVGFTCTVCRCEWFRKDSVHLTSNTQLFGWAKQDATGLVCAQCGYLHLFYNPQLRLYPATSR
jgi:predicted nucleic-acid-binding Zn-ribbon protein